MKTRIVHTKIWQDEWFCNLPRASRFVFIYLLTCPQNNICGKFEIPDRVIVFDTGITRDELEQAKKDLASRVAFYMGWVRLIHTNKYNNYVNNPKLEVALQREVELVPEEINRVLDEYDTSIDTSIYTPNNHKSEIINKKSYSDIGSINQELCNEVAKEYSVSVRAVTSLSEDLKLYCQSKGKKYANYKAALQNWVRRAIEQKKITKVVNTVVKDDVEYDPEMARQNIARIKEMRNAIIKPI